MKCLLQIIIAFIVYSMEMKEEDGKGKYENGVLVLNNKTFDNAIMNNDYALIEFYTHWCDGCRKFATDYNAIANELANDGVTVAKIDMTEEEINAKEYHNIRKYPTFKLFSKGGLFKEEYSGERKKGLIMQWVRKLLQENNQLKSLEEIEMFINKNNVSVIYFGDNTYEINNYTSVVKNESLPNGRVSIERGYNKYNVRKGTVALFKHINNEHVVLSNQLNNNLTEKNIGEFIQFYSGSFLMKITTKGILFAMEKQLTVLFFYRDSNSEQTPQQDAILERISKKVYDKIQIFASDIIKDQEMRIANYFSINKTQMPLIKLYDFKHDARKYIYNNTITEDNIMIFIRQWEEGKLKANYKSQEIPLEQSGPVYTLVGKTFKDIVMDNNKDVLVKFYAPWCGHCKLLKPIYESLAKKLKHNHYLIIAEIDSTDNEIEDEKITGFPTIKLYPAGKKDKPIKYEGMRTVEDIEQFLKQYSTNKITLFNDEL